MPTTRLPKKRMDLMILSLPEDRTVPNAVMIMAKIHNEDRFRSRLLK